MEKYKMICALNQKEQFGEEITEAEIATAVSVLLNGRNNIEEIVQYKKRMRVNPKKDCIYPDYYLPPYNGGKKLRLVQGYLPKTNILYANHYEAEILRLLVKFAPNHEVVKDMVCHTLERFKQTCFGNSCMQGNVPLQEFVSCAFWRRFSQRTKCGSISCWRLWESCFFQLEPVYPFPIY